MYIYVSYLSTNKNINFNLECTNTNSLLYLQFDTTLKLRFLFGLISEIH